VLLTTLLPLAASAVDKDVFMVVVEAFGAIGTTVGVFSAYCGWRSWSNGDNWDEISAALSYGTVRAFKPGVLLALVVYIDGIRHL
jgi:hypothetical protein